MRKLAVLLLALSLGACNGDSPAEPSPPESVIGTYVLHSVDGRALPVTLTFEGERPIVIATGVIAFQPFTDCSSHLLLLEHKADGSTVPWQDDTYCYYEHSGGSVALQFIALYSASRHFFGDENTATADGHTLTISGRGHTYVYRRQ